MAANKVIYGNRTIIDLSDSTVEPETLGFGVIAHNVKGERIVGVGIYTLPTASETVKGGVKIGSGLEMDDEVLNVKPEGVYELIETITFDTSATFTRNKEPDGTPYAFKKVCVRIESPAASLSGGYIGFRHGSTVIQRTWIPAFSSNTSKRHMLAWCEVKGGYWDVTDSDWATDRDGVQRREYHIDYFMKYAEKDYPTITDVRTAQTHAAGTVITIWGVRA